MVTFCILIAVAALIYYYMHRDKEHQATEASAPVPEKTEEPEKAEEPEEIQLVWKDDERKLYMKGDEAFLEYGGSTYSFGCQPYEPMALIYRKGDVVAKIHNSFRVSDECEVLLEGKSVHSITGKYHNAERFARLLTTALDTGYENIGDVENRMMVGLALDKGAENIEYAAYDFKCTKVLYEGVALLLGYFDCTTEIITRKSPDCKLVYALAFGYPKPDGKDMYEYYLISEEEYKEYKEWSERQDWQNHEAAYAWNV